MFRGLTVAAMLLVNNPGSWAAIYWPLAHAEWHGWTPTDLIFPFFLFIVGITTGLKRSTPWRIVRRGALILLFGLLLNAFPFYWWGKIADVAEPTLLERVVWRFEHLRVTGVLQRIGIVYTIAALVALKTSRRQQIAIVVAILLGYWATLATGPLEPPSETVAARVDRAVLGPDHIWAGGGKTWDPEGPLSTLPAIATAMLGILAAASLPVWHRQSCLCGPSCSCGKTAQSGRTAQSGTTAQTGLSVPHTESSAPQAAVDRQQGLSVSQVQGGATGRLAILGTIGVVIGLAWGAVFPINKNLWTSSYVVFTAGAACLLLALCRWLVDEQQIRGWARPFATFGMNPLVAFVGSGVMTRLTDSLIKVPVNGKPVTLHKAIYDVALAPYFPAKFASLLYALGFVLLWLLILRLLERRNILLKV